MTRNGKNSVVVLGTAFVDLKGVSAGPYDPVGRNLGSVSVIHGGVGRNVAENIANLGLPVSFVGLMDETAFGRDVARHLTEVGVDLTHAVTLPEKGLGLWMVLLDERGDLAGSISDMPDLDPLEQSMNTAGDAWIADADTFVLEVDLSEPIAEKAFDLAEKNGKDVYAIVGNMSVILARPDLMKKTACFICNEIEAAKFFDAPALTAYSPEEMAAFLPEAAQAAGLRSMVVTMGEQGSVYWDAGTDETGICPACPAQVVDTCGAGDAFFSATVMALALGKTLPEAVEYGAKLAADTVGRTEAVCPVRKDFFSSLK